MAGAGTGKTRTLVEHCVRQLLHHGVSIDQTLMLTFTEAAAAEMRERIGLRLQQELAANPSNSAVLEQIALLGIAQISTLHSYCLKLVREFFDELNLDPTITVLTANQAKALQMESFDELRDRFFSEDSPIGEAVRKFIESNGATGEKKLRSIIEAIHSFTQARPQPREWIEGQLTLHNLSEPSNWNTWLREGLRDWAELWLDRLRCEPADNTNAHGCAVILDQLRVGCVHEIPGNLDELLKGIIQWDNEWPKRKKGLYRDPIEKLFDEAKFLVSLIPTAGKDPLHDDWEWSRKPALTLLSAASEFAAIYDSKKKARAAVDFSDLEQLALELLWNTSGNPSRSALEIGRGLKWVYVDEYQDINPAQDRILRALHQPNIKLFMVGDVKQSIYRFRQAAPEIFQNYVKEWLSNPAKGSVVFLSANFRSAAQILDFNNRFFTSVMHEKLGGVAFDVRARLTCGTLPTKDLSTSEEGRSQQVEVLLQSKANSRSNAPDSGGNSDGDSDGEDLNAIELEALIVAQRLRGLRDSEFQVIDESGNARPFDWSDAVILLRAPRPKVESYAKVFESAGIPLQAKRVGFFSSIEVLDLTNILALLDNPLQDVPLLSVLRSPLAGLSVADLAEIRANSSHKTKFWHALLKYHLEKNDSDLWRGVDRFLERYHRWHELSRHASLRERLQTIITETHYADWLSIQPRGRQRLGNVEQLLAIAGEFDVIQRQGIYQFIRFINDQQDAVGDIEPAGVEDQNAVRLMSIHQSKGLEFPVVIVADLAKKFNLQERTSGVTLTDRFGFATLVRPPEKQKSYDSLPGWLARKTEREQSIGEELRMLYVAMTRPKQKLILVGSVSSESVESWGKEVVEPLAYHRIGRATNALDWLGRWLSIARPNWCESVPESSDAWYWQISTEAPEADEVRAMAPDAKPVEPFSFPDLTVVINRIEQKYPFEAETARRAKTSVSALRRQLAPDPDAEVKQFVPEPRGRFSAWTEKKLTAVETGAATHLLLEHLDLGSAGAKGWIKSEIERLTASRLISQDEIDLIDLKSIEGFWLSPVGQRFLTRREKLRRELPFTLRLPPDRGYVLRALPAAGGFVQSAQIQHDSSPCEAAAAGFGSEVEDFVVVQGVIDLAMIDSNEIWLLDFKTDRIEVSQLKERVDSYRPQLDIYKKALQEIYKVPVTHTWLHFLSIGETVSL
ncbi:MAG: recombination helicase AddA [Verrucomicrobiales bacterium]|nr:recombination helicase AddA [Verrucomicrobiales bacterium]